MSRGVGAGKGRLDYIGGDGKVPGMQILPRCPSHPPVVDGIVVVGEVIEVTLEEETEKLRASASPVRAVRVRCLQPVVDEVHHRNRHAGGEGDAWECGGGASDAALELRHRWRLEQPGEVQQRANGGGERRSMEKGSV